MRLLLALQLCCLFGAVISIPTCSQIQDMAQTLRIATAVNPGYRDSLPALFIRLGKYQFSFISVKSMSEFQ